MAHRQPWFAHVDMDAFYASVEVLDYPELAGIPLAVGGPAEGRGVIAAASYEARQYGVRSAMPTAEALRRCPHLTLRKGRMGRYQEKSREVLGILGEVAPKMETISLDEAFLDLAGCERLHAPWDAFALRLRRRIHRETGLWASIGMGETRRIAKIASDLRKPRGLVVVERGAGIGFLAPLPVERLWGVGPRMAERLHSQGFDTVGQLAEHSRSGLQSRFGKMGISLYEMSHANELGAVEPDRSAKSISHELTFAKDLVGHAALEPVLLNLSEKVAYRLRRDALEGRVVQLKIRDRGFHTFTRRITLNAPTDSEEEIYQHALRMLHKLEWEQVPVRLIGVGVHELGERGARQAELFADAHDLARPAIENVLDEVHRRYGGEMIGRAKGYLRPKDNSASWESTAWEKKNRREDDEERRGEVT